MKRALVLLFVIGCGSSKDLDRNALMDPESCRTCHPDHFREWSGSMHAYASEDPVFRAMNARGQRETNGDLGTFCVQCHAPMAVREGMTTDGLNLDSVPAAMKGVTCFFCHTAVDTHDDHNAAVDLSDELVLLGGIIDPVDNSAHEAEFAPHFDRNDLSSSDLCGTCHDIVTPQGLHLERTFAEWKRSLFAHDNAAEKNTCPSCHMAGREGVAADADNVVSRRVHDHRMPGVDLALTEFPERDDQRARVQFELDPTVILQICVVRVQDGLQIVVDVENFAAGHDWPSGAAQDRRAWLELHAYLGGNEVFATGVVPPGTSVLAAEAQDPNFWRFGDDIFDERGQPVHMFWEAVRTSTATLPAPTARSPIDPAFRDPHRRRIYDLPTVVDRIETSLHIQPIGVEVIDDLIATGDLDAGIRDQLSTISLGAAHVVWTPEAAEATGGCVPDLR